MANEEVIATLEPALPRRVFGAAVLYALGFLLLALAVFRPPSEPLGLAFLFLFGPAVLWLAHALWRATARRLVLTSEAVSEEGGRVLARIADIRAVDRGFFAFRPSNGFVLRLSAPADRFWAPGLWWRTRRMVGVGGVLRGAEARLMADAISAIVAARGQQV